MNGACTPYRKNIVAYLDNELSEKSAREMAAHLRSCAACRREQAEIAGAAQALRTWDPIAPDEQYERAFWHKVDSLAQSIPAASRASAFSDWLHVLFRSRLSVTASVAMAGIILLAAYFMMSPKNQEHGSEIRVAQDFELFENLQIIENSEALENFEIIKLLEVLDEDEPG